MRGRCYLGQRRLDEELENLRALAAARATPERAALQAEALAEIDRVVAGRAIGAGTRAPAFTLLSATSGATVELIGLLREGPVVLSFYRGQWCPYCNVELRAIEERYGEIKDLGAEVLFIGPETTEKARMIVEKNAASVPVLCDSDGEVMAAYGLVFEVPESLRPMYERLELNPATGWKLPVPATYVIRQDGIIASAFTNADYRFRMDPEDIIAALKAIAPAQGH